jgi:8-oxo-dGTP pyrophosphatase MutT (NUDIX family)
MKVVSVANLIIDKDTRKLLICHSTGKDYASGGFDLPKGHHEEGEEYIDTAIREAFEETGLKLSKDKMIYLGRTAYTSEKDLEWFYTEMDIDLRKVKCTSYFEREGKEYPEVNKFELIDPCSDEINKLFPILRHLVRSKLHAVMDFKKEDNLDWPESYKELMAIENGEHNDSESNQKLLQIRNTILQ